MGTMPTSEKLALTALLPLGIIMLAIGMSLEGSDPDEIVPAFKLKEKFGVAFGEAFAAEPDKIRQACRMVGALKIVTVFNVWSRAGADARLRGAERRHPPPGTFGTRTCSASSRASRCRRSSSSRRRI